MLKIQTTLSSQCILMSLYYGLKRFFFVFVITEYKTFQYQTHRYGILAKFLILSNLTA